MSHLHSPNHSSPTLTEQAEVMAQTDVERNEIVDGQAVIDDPSATKTKVTQDGSKKSEPQMSQGRKYLALLTFSVAFVSFSFS